MLERCSVDGISRARIRLVSTILSATVVRKLALRSFVVDRRQLLVEARRREVHIDRGRAARSHAPSRTFRERVRVVAQRYRHARPRVGQDSLCAANLGLGSSGFVPPFLGHLRGYFQST